MVAVCPAFQFFLLDIRGHHVLVRSDSRSVVCVIHNSPGRPHLEVTLHAGKRSSCVGSEQSALTEGNACAGQNEPRSRHVVEEQYLFFSQVNGTIWHPWPELWALHVWPLDGSLPEHVLNTMAESRASSTRRFYALKCSIFSA